MSPRLTSPQSHPASEGLPYPNGAGQTAGNPGQGVDVYPVHQVGGQLLEQFLHPAITSFEQLYSALPEPGWHRNSLSPSSPSQITLGSFKIPKGMSLWVMDYSFTAFRFSGANAGELIEVEDRRLTGSAYFTIEVNGASQGNTRFQLQPQNARLARPDFNPTVYTTGTAPVSKFRNAESFSFAATAGQGAAALPDRKEKYGPEDGPFTIIADEDQQVALGFVVYHKISFPVASIEGRVAGFLMAINLSESLKNRMRPR